MLMTSTCLITFLDDELFADQLFLGLKLMVQRMGGTTAVDFEVLELSQPFQMVEGLEAKVKVGCHHVLRGLRSKIGILPNPSILPGEEVTAWAPLAGGCISQFLEDFTITIKLARVVDSDVVREVEWCQIVQLPLEAAKLLLESTTLAHGLFDTPQPQRSTSRRGVVKGTGIYRDSLVIDGGD